MGQGLSPLAHLSAGAILALDAATATVVVGIAGEDGRILSERRLHGSRGDVVPGLVASLLEELSMDPSAISSVVCGVGPGSFTGIRIALAFAHGFSFRRGLPLRGVSSLGAVLAHPSLPVDRPRAALLDALRGEAYCRRLEPGQGPCAGEDVRIPLDGLEPILSGSPVVVAEGRADFLAALSVGWIRLSELVSAQGLVDLRGILAEPLPNYLRASAPEELRAEGSKHVQVLDSFGAIT